MERCTGKAGVFPPALDLVLSLCGPSKAHEIKQT